LSKDKVRIGIIGAGRIGKVHAETLAFRIPEAVTVAIADLNESAAKSLAEHCGISRVERDPGKIINDSEIDAVLICSPTDTHADLIVHGGGNRMLARTIRYIEERRANERRFTGAISQRIRNYICAHPWYSARQLSRNVLDHSAAPPEMRDWKTGCDGEKRRSRNPMQPMQGELVIMLTSGEAEALRKALATLVSKTKSGDTQTLKSIQDKLRIAEEKML